MKSGGIKTNIILFFLIDIGFYKRILRSNVFFFNSIKAFESKVLIEVLTYRTDSV